MSTRMEEIPVETQTGRVRRFNRFYTRFLGLLNESLLETGVSLTEARVIYEIHNTPRCKASDLIKILDIDRGYLSRILRRLESRGLIRKESDSNDRRVRTLTSTDTGYRLWQELNDKASDQIESILNTLSEEDRSTLVRSMDSIQDILNQIDRLAK